jgi:hypothetical protein
MYSTHRLHRQAAESDDDDVLGRSSSPSSTVSIALGTRPASRSVCADGGYMRRGNVVCNRTVGRRFGTSKLSRKS